MTNRGEQETERLLREAVLRGDQAAWHLLYERHFDVLYATVHARTGRRIDRTEEVIQEAWLVAVRRIADFDPGKAAFASWLFGIAENVLRNQQRRWQGERRMSEWKDEPEAPMAPDGTSLAERMSRAMAALPAHYRLVLQWKYEERLSVADISKRRGDSVKAIESLLTRARATFREVYAKLD